MTREAYGTPDREARNRKSRLQQLSVIAIQR